MSKQPPKIIYLQDKDDDGNYCSPAEIETTWCSDCINDTDSVYVHQPKLEKSLRLFAMKYLPNGVIDWRSIRATRKDSIADFEQDFGHSWRELQAAGWQCVRVGVVTLGLEE